MAQNTLSRHNLLPAKNLVLNELVNRIHDKHWYEVILLTLTMLDSSDDLFLLMKTKIDELLLDDEALQKFLTWVIQKSRSVDIFYKPAAIRAFYFDNCDLSFFQHIDNTSLEYLDSIPIVSLKGDIQIDHNLQNALGSSFMLSQDIQQDPEGCPNVNQAIYYSSDGLFGASTIWEETCPESFKTLIQELHQYNPHEQWQEFKQWWQDSGQNWTEKLKLFMVKYRNIGHDWQFSKKQHDRLKQYSDANQFLIRCLNSNCTIRINTRQEIEETLLLPIAEIERRKCENVE